MLFQWRLISDGSEASTALFTGIMETDRFLPVAGLLFLVLFESLDNFPHQAVADNIAVI